MDSVIDYLKLLKIMREDQDLFKRKEITVSALDLRKIIALTAQSAPFPVDRFAIYDFLKLSFDIPRFLNNYVELAKIIMILAKSETLAANYPRLKIAMPLHSLGYLGRLLHYYGKNSKFKFDQQAALAEIKQTGNALYELYKPDNDKPLLDFLFFEKFVSEITVDNPAINPSDVCDRDYPNHCNPEYQNFKAKFSCPEGRFPHFTIEIAYDNLTNDQLLNSCRSMRAVEVDFFAWLKTIAWTPQSTKRSFLLNVSPTSANFSFTVQLFEKHERDPLVAGIYFAKAKQNNYFRGVAYSDQMVALVSEHEYMHQLFSMVINRPWSHKMLSEGIPEVFDGGVCHFRYLHELTINASDITILEDLKNRRFSGYIDAFKWSAFLINEKPQFLKALLSFYHAGKKEEFYSLLDEFLIDRVQVSGFLEWTQLRAQYCKEYSQQNPGFEKSSIYLADVRKQIIATREFSVLQKNSPSQILPRNEINDSDSLAYQILLAIHRNDPPEVDRLLEQGANTDWQEPYTGNNLLHYLFYYQVYSNQIAQSLLQFGVDVNAYNKDGVTPYQVAESRLKALTTNRDRDVDSEEIRAIKHIIALFRQSLRSTVLVPLTVATTPRPVAGLTNQTSKFSVIASDKPTDLLSTTEIITYKEKFPYEYHILINTSTGIAKGLLTALTRYGFEKFMKKSTSFDRRHLYTRLAIKTLFEAGTLSAFNLFYFPSTRGMINNYSTLTSAAVYFGMDIGAGVGVGLLNTKLQMQLTIGSDDSWIMFLVKNLGTTGLYTLLFLVSNVGILLGENFKDHRTEVLLSGLLHTLFVMIIHQLAYQSIKVMGNCISKTSKRDAGAIGKGLGEEPPPFIFFTLSRTVISSEPASKTFLDKFYRLQEKMREGEYLHLLGQLLCDIESFANLIASDATSHTLRILQKKLNRLEAKLTSTKLRNVKIPKRELQVLLTRCIEALQIWKESINKNASSSHSKYSNFTTPANLESRENAIDAVYENIPNIPERINELTEASGSGLSIGSVKKDSLVYSVSSLLFKPQSGVSHAPMDRAKRFNTNDHYDVPKRLDRILCRSSK